MKKAKNNTLLNSLESRNTRVVIAIASVIAVYGFLSLAIDTASIWAYIAAAISLYVFIDSLSKLVKFFVKDDNGKHAKPRSKKSA